MPTLEWIGKEKVVNHDLDVPYHVLERQYSFDSEGEHIKDNGSDNMIIHGDNLLALKALLPQYEGRIKCAYIDPPYNTGNEKWVYNDNVNDPRIRKWLGEVVGKEGEDLSRHDKWLCMMYPRLKLLHKLLAEDGVVFISIDDMEFANLKYICDEIFGRSNYIDCLHWKRKKQPSYLAKHTAKVIEYVLVYAKKREKLEKLSIETLSDKTKKVVNNDNRISIRHFKKGVRVKIGKDGIIKKGKYKIKTMEVEYLNDIIYQDGMTCNEVDVKAQFSVSQEKIDDYINDNLLFITVNKGLRRDVSSEEQKKGKSITDLLLDWGDNQDSEKELQAIFGHKTFDYPKPKKLIKNLIKTLDDREDFIVLDSFAGSGTTAHAVLELNEQYSSNKKFILIEMCDYVNTITAERVKRAIKGYGTEEQTAKGFNGHFSYYELGDTIIKK